MHRTFEYIFSFDDGEKVRRNSSSLHFNLSAKYCYGHCANSWPIGPWLAPSIAPITKIKCTIIFFRTEQTIYALFFVLFRQHLLNSPPSYAVSASLAFREMDSVVNIYFSSNELCLLRSEHSTNIIVISITILLSYIAFNLQTMAQRTDHYRHHHFKFNYSFLSSSVRPFSPA